jgi:Vacuolar sorting-associated protein 13, N-terminal/N-terminal region of Chorein or VPS13
VTEDVIGEYVLNISKENIKIAAHRGKVKLESVQLDGDLIGSHVLGAAGLSGFGVLSCWAKTMTIFVPLKNLEKEPTRFELQGLHLVCVPLLPATAHKEYGAGTAVDPRCTLRTRAKRSALARYERNYFGGRIPGEGPPNRRIKVALKEAEQRLKKGQWRPATVQDVEASIESEGFMDDVVSELGDSFYTDSEDKSSKGEGVPEDLLSPQRTWKVKMREKVMRNLEVSMRDVHVRCEVAEQGLDFSQNVDKSRRRRSEKLPAEQRAFAFGVTVESAFVRTANDKWEVGSSRFVGDGSSSEQRTSVSSASGSSSTPRDVENRVMQVNNMAVYWDDDPPLLISETYVLRCNLHNLPPTKLQGRIAVAMEAMVQYQDPGLVIRKSLDKSEPGSPLRKSKSFSNISIECGSKLHDFCCHSFSGTVRGKLSGRNMPGPMQLFAEFMPLEVNLTFHPHQFLQYQKLRSAMLSQQRFDTMLRQRPKVEISDDPRLWWKYTIACVTTRPTSRPWEDVIQIVRSRSRYIELAKKKILNASEGNGFHAGLKESDSLELLALEDLLPIEALTAFHLLALREAFEWQKEKRTPVEKGKLKYQRTLLSGPSSIPKPRLNPFRRVLSAGRIRSSSVDTKNRAKDLLDSMPRDDNSILSSITRASLLQALQDRLGKKQWHVTFKLHNIKFIVSLVQDCRPIVRLELCTRGLVRTVGPDSREFAFDISQFEVFDCQNHAAGFTLTHSSPGSKILMFEGAGRNHSLFGDHVASQGAENEDERVLALPPPGVVCRVSAASDFMSLTLGVSAHPATLVWNTLCIESIAEFFSTPSVELKTEVTRQLQNVATPLARKALLAFLSPSAIALNLNIAAPKLWFPISPRRSDGAVCLDAGKFRVECHKGMSKTDTKWNVDARDIQVMFVRPNKSSPTSENHGDSPISDAEEVSIIKPLHVRIDAELCEKQTSTTNTGGEYEFHRNRDNGMANDGPSRRIDITVSPICLNLVDAEVLARAIGKWYASGLVKAKKRVSTKSEPAKEHNKREFVDSDAENAATESLSKQKSSSDKYSLQIERIELALEGHSKPLVPPTREHSMLIDTEVREVYSTGPTTRTYLLELFGIDLRRSGQGGATKTILMVSDASIVKIQGDAAFSPSKPNHQRAEDPQNTILIREEKDIPRSNTFSDELHCLVPPSTPSTKISRVRVDHSFETPRLQLSPGNFADSFEKPSFATAVDTGILCVNLFHDKEQHLDEVEIDMDSVVIRVTPTSLKDCAKAVRRALELVQLVTREMERKVHEEGRKARQRDREGDISQQPRHSRPISPVPTRPCKTQV